MAISLPYAQSALSMGISDVSQEEREALQQTRGSMQKPLDFDLDGAFVALSDKGFDERTATNTIAQKLSEKANFDLTGARKAGFTNEMIIAKLIGRDADDLESSKLYSFGEGVGRGAVEAAPAGATGAAVAGGLTLGAKALGLGLGAKVGLGVAGLTVAPGAVVIGGLGFLSALAVGAFTDYGEQAEDALFDERQLLPSERGYGTAGRALGSAVSYAPLSKLTTNAIKDTQKFAGSRNLLAGHYKNRKKMLKDAGLKPTSKAVKLESEIPALVKRAKGAEEFVAGVGKRSREQSFSSSSAEELMLALAPAAFEGFAEALYPGDDVMRTIGGLTGGLATLPSGLAGDAIIGTGKTVSQDVSEKGLVGSAKNLFGALDRTERVRQRKAAQYIAQTFKQFGGDPVEFAAELDRLIAADPEFAKLVTAGQLSNDPILLLMEGTTRRGNQVLSNQQKRAGEDAAAHVRGLIETLKMEGSEASLKAAAELEKTATETGLTALLDMELSHAALAAEKLGLREVGKLGEKTSVDIQAEQGAIIKNAALTAMEKAKKIRKDLYDAVDKQVEVDTSPVLAAYRRLRQENLLTEADDLKGTFIKDLRNYGLDEPDGAVSDALNTLTGRQKTLTSNNTRLGNKFDQLAQGNNDAFDEYDKLVDSLGGPNKRGYTERLNKVLNGFSKKTGEEGALGLELPRSVRNDVLKLAKQAQAIETNKIELQKVTDSLATVDFDRIVSDVPQMKTIGELLAFRNKVRQQYRVAARGVVEGPTTAQLNVLDDGVTQAIGKRIEDGTLDGEVSDNIKALVAAENYARSYQEVFGRTFAGKLGRTGQAGAEVIDPESALEELFSGSAAKQTKAVKDMVAAMNFDGVDDELLGTVTGAMDVFLRNKLAVAATPTQVTNPLTGTTETVLQLDPAQLRTFVDENQTLLNTMDPSGALLDDLSNAGTAQVNLEASLNKISEHAKNSGKEVALAKFLEADSAETLITKVINSDTVATDLNQLSKRINAANTSDSQKNEFKEAMFSTVLASALRASTSNGAVDFKKLNGILFATGKTKDLTGFSNFPEGTNSLMGILQSNDGVLPEQVTALKDFLKRGENLQDALGSSVDDFLAAKETSAVKDLVARVGGSQAANAVLRRLGFQPDIQSAGAGAAAAKNMFINMPQVMLKDILVDLSRPGQAGSLANLMRQGAEIDVSSNKILRRIGQRILGAPSYVQSLTIRAADAAMEEQPALDEPPVAAVEPMAPPMPPPQMAAPMAPPSAAPQPRPAAQPAPAGDQRSRYAAMFPNDPISSLINQQGIASLPQAPS